MAGLVILQVLEHFSNSCEDLADILLWNFLFFLAVVLDDVFQRAIDVAVLDEYLGLVVVGAAEGGGLVGFREEIAGGEQIGVGELAALLEKGRESLHVLLLEHQVLVDRPYGFVEQHLAAVPQHAYIFPRWLYNFLRVVAHSIIIRLGRARQRADRMR